MTTDMFPFEEPLTLNTLGDLIRSQPPAWEQKCWGEVQHVFNSPDVAVSVLKVKAGFRCSKHLHRTRVNRFVVVSGCIKVWSWASEAEFHEYPDNPTWVDDLHLGGVQTTTVSAEVPHMFVVRESGLVVEIYTPDGGPVDIDDIVRFDEGGSA